MDKMFLGRERMTVDVKGRVPIPARFMNVLREMCPDQWQTLGVLVSPERSLMIMPLPAFEEFLAKGTNLNFEKEDERIKMNLMYSSADRIDLDAQNRIRLTPAIIEDCAIDMEARSVIFTGGQRFMQLWDEATWKHFRNAGLTKLSQISDRLATRDAAPASTVFYQQLVPSGAATPQPSLNPVSSE